MRIQMSNLKRVLVCIAVGLIAVIIGTYAFMPREKRLNKIEINFPSQHLSSIDLQAFLAGDFKLVRDTRRLPSSVLQAYTERGGSRLAMANPGTRFEATDYISDSSVPRKRLIFAAFTQDKCIVSYEQGGYALTFNIALFRLSSAHAEPVWKGFCSATDLENLRSEVAKGRCKTDGE
jgi:hypothetical protein